MNKYFKHLYIALICLFAGFSSYAQDTPEMADLMRSNGKIYVVVGCCLIILVGLFLYVWRVDRKISQVEKRGHL